MVTLPRVEERDGRIASDYAGFGTWDSCVRAKKIFGVDRAVLVSQGFRPRRAIACAGRPGSTVFQPDPHSLGPHEPSVAEALATEPAGPAEVDGAG